jgi:hypothetical protein
MRARRPICSMRPLSITTTRSATPSASSWSWVTKIVVTPISVVQLAQPLAQFLAHLGVERAERLVEQQHARLDRQRAGQRDALALAAGQLAGIAAAQPVELHQIQQLLRRGARISARSAASRARAHRRPKATFFEHRHVRNSA